jgi:dolichyl-phosphate beta-glucosyltransferase
VSTEEIAFSLVLPAFNEAARLPPYLASIRPYLDAQYGDRYEVLVVDDGSQDRLCEVLQPVSAGWPQLQVLRSPENRGKGAAVRMGVLASRGSLLLFADADGAAPIAEHRRLEAAIRAGADVAVGSRLLPAADVRRRRNRFRGLAGKAFAAVARRLLGLSVRDPQCGFKIFRGEAGRRLFSLTGESRYLFDLELLALAQRLGYRVVEVPINWQDIPGGHVRLFRELPGIVAGLWRLRRKLRGEAGSGKW